MFFYTKNIIFFLFAVYPSGGERKKMYVFVIPLITLTKRLLKSQMTGGRTLSKFSHSLFGTCEGCELHAHSLTDFSRATQIVWVCVCNRERWGGDKQCVCCKCVWGVTMCISALVCDSSSVFESVPAGPPSGLRQAQPTESLLIKTVLSSRRWVYWGQNRNFLHICIITLLSRFHEEETEQGFINQHIRSLKHSCSCLHVLFWWIIIWCWFTQRPDMIHRIEFRQHNANCCSITQWKTKSCM